MKNGNDNFINDKDYLDQHFLVSKKVINDFIKDCNLNKEDIVIEVGPGKGTLTKQIASQVKSLTVIELDKRLKEYLDIIPNINVIYDSVLNIDLPNANKLITSIPYSIIEPFIHKMSKTNIKEIYMIMGSKYVDSVINKDITYLSLLTNTYYNAEKLFDISPDCFNPKPRVMSSVIKLIKKDNFTNLDLFFKNMYELDNKKIKNALMESLINVKNITKRDSKEIINSLNIKEELLNKKFLEITNIELKDLYNIIVNNKI